MGKGEVPKHSLLHFVSVDLMQPTEHTVSSQKYSENEFDPCYQECSNITLEVVNLSQTTKRSGSTLLLATYIDIRMHRQTYRHRHKHTQAHRHKRVHT